jgi:WG containing repeat
MIAASTSSCEWDYEIWIPRSGNADALYRFTKGGKVGYIDQTGKIVVPANIRFWGGNSAGEFHNCLLEISIDGGVYVNASGKKVIDKGLYRGWDFSEGLAVAMEKDGGKWGYINTKASSQ